MGTSPLSMRTEVLDYEKGDSIMASQQYLQLFMEITTNQHILPALSQTNYIISKTLFLIFADEQFCYDFHGVINLNTQIFPTKNYDIIHICNLI